MTSAVRIQSPRHRMRVVLTQVVCAALFVALIAGVPFAVRYGQSDLASAIAGLFLTLSTLAVGWLIAWRQPRNPVGWMLVLAVAFFALGPMASVAANAVQDSAPVASEWLRWFAGDGDSSWSWVPPVWLLLVGVPLRFPNGALPSRGWRWFWWVNVLWVLAGSCAFATTMRGPDGGTNPTLVPFLKAQQGPIFLVLVVIGIACFGGTVLSLVVRYRRGDQVLRAQLRWAIWGVAIAVILLATSWFLPQSLNFVDGFVLAAYGLIPIAIGIAVLRYRLYEIDRIISRTAAWLIVTLITVGTYAVVVITATSLLPSLPSVGVALATLVAAGVFLPVLRRVRGGVDRVFNRAQYNAERVVDLFGQRIRDGADPHSTARDLTVAIERTLQPQRIGLWIPGDER